MAPGRAALLWALALAAAPPAAGVRERRAAVEAALRLPIGGARGAASAAAVAGAAFRSANVAPAQLRDGAADTRLHYVPKARPAEWQPGEDEEGGMRSFAPWQGARPWQSAAPGERAGSYAPWQGRKPVAAEARRPTAAEASPSAAASAEDATPFFARAPGAPPLSGVPHAGAGGSPWDLAANAAPVPSHAPAAPPHERATPQAPAETAHSAAPSADAPAAPWDASAPWDAAADVGPTLSRAAPAPQKPAQHVLGQAALRFAPEVAVVNDDAIMDSYMSVKLLGSVGGPTVVFLAERAEGASVQFAPYPKLLALKVFRRAAPGSEQRALQNERISAEVNYAKRFEREVGVKIYFVGVSEDRVSIAMEAGKELPTRLPFARYPLESRMLHSLGVADKVAWLEAQGVLHGDLRLDHIRMKRDGAPALVDFGTARELAAGPGQTDIWSLGALIYTMAFEGHEPAAMTDRAAAGAWPDLQEDPRYLATMRIAERDPTGDFRERMAMTQRQSWLRTLLGLLSDMLGRDAPQLVTAGQAATRLQALVEELHDLGPQSLQAMLAEAVVQAERPPPPDEEPEAPPGGEERPGGGGSGAPAAVRRGASAYAAAASYATARSYAGAPAADGQQAEREPHGMRMSLVAEPEAAETATLPEPLALHTEVPARKAEPPATEEEAPGGGGRGVAPTPSLFGEDGVKDAIARHLSREFDSWDGGDEEEEAPYYSGAIEDHSNDFADDLHFLDYISEEAPASGKPGFPVSFDEDGMPVPSREDAATLDIADDSAWQPTPGEGAVAEDVATLDIADDSAWQPTPGEGAVAEANAGRPEEDAAEAAILADRGVMGNLAVAVALHAMDMQQRSDVEDEVRDLVDAWSPEDLEAEPSAADELGEVGAFEEKASVEEMQAFLAHAAEAREAYAAPAAEEEEEEEDAAPAVFGEGPDLISEEVLVDEEEEEDAAVATANEVEEAAMATAADEDVEALDEILVPEPDMHSADLATVDAPEEDEAVGELDAAEDVLPEPEAAHEEDVLPSHTDALEHEAGQPDADAVAHEAVLSDIRAHDHGAAPIADDAEAHDVVAPEAPAAPAQATLKAVDAGDGAAGAAAAATMPDLARAQPEAPQEVAAHARPEAGPAATEAHARPEAGPAPRGLAGVAAGADAAPLIGRAKAQAPAAPAKKTTQPTWGILSAMFDGPRPGHVVREAEPRKQQGPWGVFSKLWGAHDDQPAADAQKEAADAGLAWWLSTPMGEWTRALLELCRRKPAAVVAGAAPKVDATPAHALADGAKKTPARKGVADLYEAAAMKERAAEVSRVRSQRGEQGPKLAAPSVKSAYSADAGEASEAREAAPAPVDLSEVGTQQVAAAEARSLKFAKEQREAKAASEARTKAAEERAKAARAKAAEGRAAEERAKAARAKAADERAADERAAEERAKAARAKARKAKAAVAKAKADVARAKAEEAKARAAIEKAKDVVDVEVVHKAASEEAAPIEAVGEHAMEKEETPSETDVGAADQVVLKRTKAPAMAEAGAADRVVLKRKTKPAVAKEALEKGAPVQAASAAAGEHVEPAKVEETALPAGGAEAAMAAAQGEEAHAKLEPASREPTVSGRSQQGEPRVQPVRSQLTVGGVFDEKELRSRRWAAQMSGQRSFMGDPARGAPAQAPPAPVRWAGQASQFHKPPLAQAKAPPKGDAAAPQDGQKEANEEELARQRAAEEAHKKEMRQRALRPDPTEPGRRRDGW